MSVTGVWSYSGDPTSSLKDQVRFLVQDTDKEAQLVSDEEIRYSIETEAPGASPDQAALFAAAALVLEALSRRFSAQADTEVGSLKTDYSKQAEGYTKRANELRMRAVNLHGAPIATGQSKETKQAQRENPDRVQPAFTREEFTSPYKGDPTAVGLPVVGPGEESI